VQGPARLVEVAEADGEVVSGEAGKELAFGGGEAIAAHSGSLQVSGREFVRNEEGSECQPFFLFERGAGLEGVLKKGGGGVF
jgi:hypothetical protein